MNGGAGTLLDGKAVNIIGKTFIAKPNQICSNALLAIGEFNTLNETQNLEKYMHTKFQMKFKGGNEK